MVSNTSTEQLSLLFRLAIASVNGFRLVRSGTGSKKSLLRLKQSPGTVDGWPPQPSSTTRMRQGFGGDGLAKGGTRERLHCPQAPGKPY